MKMDGLEKVDDPRIEAKARELYEQSRKRVSGRPRWERLNRDDPYDMGMKAHAYDQALRAIQSSSKPNEGGQTP